MISDWYWGNGLHDADIIECKEFECLYDFKNPNAYRNYLELTIDSNHASWDNTIKKIILYNYKIISELKTAKGIWWLEDNIRGENGKYILTIRGHNKEQFIVKFSNAEKTR